MFKSFFELLYSTRTDIEFFVGGPGTNEKLKQKEPTWFYINSKNLSLDFKVEIFSTKTKKQVPVMMEVLPQYNVVVVFYTNESTKSDELAISVERGAIRRKFLVEIEAKAPIDKTDKQEPNQLQTLDVASIQNNSVLSDRTWLFPDEDDILDADDSMSSTKTPTPTLDDSKTCEIHKKQLELLTILAEFEIIENAKIFELCENEPPNSYIPTRLYTYLDEWTQKLDEHQINTVINKIAEIYHLKADNIKLTMKRKKEND
ncbi:unnamed protein product [Caenorhabditis angaria]|uniref:Uncharacterized protein n=1 Tax=Caenorhabditis angaria TaxID=860376 RepID=A0A9P1ISS8_9PELO|nr:unnamed protein product [Caenorhabditis angaria]